MWAKFREKTESSNTQQSKSFYSSGYKTWGSELVNSYQQCRKKCFSTGWTTPQWIAFSFSPDFRIIARIDVFSVRYYLQSSFACARFSFASLCVQSPRYTPTAPLHVVKNSLHKAVFWPCQTKDAFAESINIIALASFVKLASLAAHIAYTARNKFHTTRILSKWQSTLGTRA